MERAILTEDEAVTQLLIKVDMPSNPGDSATKNLGECAVLACAQHRRMVAVVDDADAAEQLYEALLATEMRLPRVESFIGWAYEKGYLPGE